MVLRSTAIPPAATPMSQDICDRLVEDARIFLMIIDRQQAGAYEAALDALVRDAFGTADRLRAATAQARASGRPAAEGRPAGAGRQPGLVAPAAA